MRAQLVFTHLEEWRLHPIGVAFPFFSWRMATAFSSPSALSPSIALPKGLQVWSRLQPFPQPSIPAPPRASSTHWGMHPALAGISGNLSLSPCPPPGPLHLVPCPDPFRNVGLNGALPVRRDRSTKPSPTFRWPTIEDGLTPFRVYAATGPQAGGRLRPVPFGPRPPSGSPGLGEAADCPADHRFQPLPPAPP